MNFNSKVFATAACTLLMFATVGAEEIRDLIAPVRIAPDKPDTLLVSDMFYAKKYDLRVTPGREVGATYNAASNTLILKSAAGFSGAALVEFKVGDTRQAIPVLVQRANVRQQTYTFRYRPTAPVRHVYVTGSFNNWSKEKNELLDANGSGVYEADVPLDPGSYIYKLVVDGKEILDPSNPEKTPTGFDDFNSVVRVADADSTKLFLHIGGRKSVPNGIEFSFVCENSAATGQLNHEQVIALLQNTTIDSQRIAIEGRTIRITVPLRALKGEKTLRVIVSENGKTTNLQQVVMRNGLPASALASRPAWEDGVIYSIMIDRFCDGDKKNDIPVVHDSLFWQANYEGGDLQGIIKKIDEGYFDTLGVNILWISPVNDNPDIAYREYPPPHRWYSGYHGYWPISENRVEEKFGTMKLLKELIAKAHTHHMRVLLDYVAHHVHIDHPWYKEHPDWFGTLDLPDGRKNLRLWDEFRLTTWFEPYMPSFDYTKSKDALNAMSDNAVWWLKETGADGFRHDAVKHVPNEFWRTLTRKIKERIEIPRKQPVYQIGETFGDYDLIASYVNNGQLNAQFNFNLSYFAIPVFLEPDKSFAFIDFHMKKSFASFGANNLMGNIMDSHDKVRFMAYADGDVAGQGVDTREMAWNNPPTVDHPSSYKKAELYFAYMMTIPGLPVIYYGSEFGMTGADDPDNRRMMRFGDSLSAYEKEMKAHTAQLVKIRTSHSALRYGDFLTLQADTTVYAYVRSDMNERLLIVLNKSERPAQVSVTLPAAYAAKELIDVTGGPSAAVQAHHSTVTVPGIGWRIFKIH
ncbi:MAG TPA: alpha-amylase family glycosyl hydrolase [Bacteroidota bacterium]|nr:alpha-amylase family glycosyl hydrolase [Bacteroidota bacterium]